VIEPTMVEGRRSVAGVAFAQRAERLLGSLGQVVRGKDLLLRQALAAVLAEGHLLVEDVPGTGKTSLARGLAAAVQLEWNRIQFTPDLLPTDVTGVSVYNQASGTFEFRRGPVFANVVVADEINRASPKTQSALLEVMEERTVTTDAVVYPVPRPFVVVATQNPVDMEGTYPLPEAQLDRFLMRLTVGYPSGEAEADILRREKDGPTVERLTPVIDGHDLTAMIDHVKSVEVSPALEDYIVGVVAATRQAPEVRLGASPRGSLALLRAARAWAAIDDRPFVTPDDVKACAVPVLCHRLLLRPEAELQGRTAADVVDRVLQQVPVPRQPVR
jgi:MoxR-like ATPase